MGWWCDEEDAREGPHFAWSTTPPIVTEFAVYAALSFSIGQDEEESKD